MTMSVPAGDTPASSAFYVKMLICMSTGEPLPETPETPLPNIGNLEERKLTLCDQVPLRVALRLFKSKFWDYEPSGQAIMVIYDGSSNLLCKTVPAGTPGAISPQKFTYNERINININTLMTPELLVTLMWTVL